tara:strand:+ start:1212 stop:1490 length:279 start_codon:yes stop_codon:yes gene_type:complete
MYNYVSILLIIIIVLITVVKVILLLKFFYFVKSIKRETFKTCGSKYLEALSPYDSYKSITHSWCGDKLPKNLKSKRGETIDDVNKCYGELLE